MSQTQIGYGQINPAWKVAGGLGIVLTASVGVVTFFTGRNAAGLATYKHFSDGSTEQSGSLLVGSGTTTLYADSVNAKVGIGTRSPKATLEVAGTASAATVIASRAFSGAGLVSCSTNSTDKLLWNSTTGRFSCGSDQTGAGGGMSFSTAEGIYVNQKGDTMTGALTINLTSGTLGLKVLQTASGNIIHAEKDLTSSGTITAAGMVSGRGGLSGSLLTLNSSTTASNYMYGSLGVGTASPSYNLHVKGAPGGGDTQFALEDPDTSGANGAYARLISQGSLPSAGFLFNGGGTQFWSVQFNSANSQANLQISRDAGAGNLFLLNSNVGINTTNPKAKLDVVGTVSGSSVVSVSAMSPVHLEVQVFGSGSSVTTGSGKAVLDVPYTMSGFTLVSAHASVRTAGTTNGTTVNVTDLDKASRKLFSTPITIDTGKTGSHQSATPFALNAGSLDVGGYDRLSIDVNGVSTTAPKGLTVLLIFRKP